jgi:hypothetical protein
MASLKLSKVKMKINSTNRLKATYKKTAVIDTGRYDEWAEISFRVKGDAKHILQKILGLLAFLGNAGASRTIVVEDVPSTIDGRIPEGDIKFGFDGDGADEIEDIRVNGQPLDTKTLTYAKVKRRVLAASDLVKEGSYNITEGGNSFRFPSPEEAYEKAAEFIKQLKRDGFKFDPHGTMSDRMDAFKKGSREISVSVRNSILNIDLW